MKIKLIVVVLLIACGLQGAQKPMNNDAEYNAFLLKNEIQENRVNIGNGLFKLATNKLVIHYYQTDQMRKFLPTNAIGCRTLEAQIVEDNKYAIGLLKENKVNLPCDRFAFNTHVYKADNEGKWSLADFDQAQGVVFNFFPSADYVKEDITGLCEIIKLMIDADKKVLINVEKKTKIERYLAKEFPDKNWVVIETQNVEPDKPQPSFSTTKILFFGIPLAVLLGIWYYYKNIR